jgi:hypothetical protein
VELEAYEYHAFIDFREIRDDDYGTWGRVCAELGGRPVESLEEEVRQIRHAGVLAALRSLISVLQAQLPSLFDPSSPKASRVEAGEAMRKCLRSFFSALKHDTGFPVDEREEADRALREVDTIREIAALKSRRAGAKPAIELLKSELSPEKGWNGLLLAVFLILRRTGNRTVETPDGMRPVEVFSKLGFGRVLSASFRVAAERSPNVLSPWGSEVDVHILKILLEQGAFLAEREGETQSVRAMILLDRPDVRDFLLVNESGGAEWFNKERFEALIRMLCLTASVVASHEKETGLQINDIIRFHRAAQKLIDNAERAGYRSDIFLQLSASG